MFRTQHASTISAARNKNAPTFWAADVFYSPASTLAYAGSFQPDGK
jgi:hypothetical protein